MKNQFARFLTTIIILFTLPTSIALPGPALSDEFYSSPLLLNGKSISLEQLTNAMSGTIELVKGAPGTTQAIKVPFKIHLKRSGVLLNIKTFSNYFAVTECDLREVLKFAWAGDELIVEPANKNESVGQRKIIVTRRQLLPQFNWLMGLTVNNSKEGC